jgi:hypothetical protein
MGVLEREVTEGTEMAHLRVLRGLLFDIAVFTVLFSVSPIDSFDVNDKTDYGELTYINLTAGLGQW